MAILIVADIDINGNIDCKVIIYILTVIFAIWENKKKNCHQYTYWQQ